MAPCLTGKNHDQTTLPIWGFPEMGVPKNGWFIRENPIKMDDLGLFRNPHIGCSIEGYPSTNQPLGLQEIYDASNVPGDVQ